MFDFQLVNDSIVNLEGALLGQPLIDAIELYKFYFLYHMGIKVH